MRKPLIVLLALLLPHTVHANSWDFDVYLDKTKIGQHKFSLSETNKLISEANFNVKLLFINAYSYQHTAVEQWQDHCLKSLEATTLENKVLTKVKGRLGSSGFELDDGKSKQTLPECPMTFAYWSQRMLEQSKLLNPQNAEWLDTKIVKVGKETLEVKGKPVETLRYRLNASLEGKPKLNIDLWYRADNQDWVALKSITPEGYNIHYKLR